MISGLEIWKKMKVGHGVGLGALRLSGGSGVSDYNFMYEV